VVLFAIAMGISNIALLRHERMWLPNMMGLLVSVALIAGEAVGWHIFNRDFMGSEWEWRVQQTFVNTGATVFAYCECMLAGSVVCGIRAARHQPAPDKDFIIILGCWFRGDGTLPPLLRGRVDRAVAFWRGQKEKTGKEAFFIPSGGQGKDEPMSEAEAMRRYLVSQGVPDSLILPETRSENTYQNMEYSKAIIQETEPGGRAVFATTNYHVFRSGLWASLAGLPAEGIGSRTKWWYWPNAFMREVVGLLKKRWKQEIFGLILLISFFAVLSLALG
jgi:vancomycin permeability regulator SanA